MIMKKNILLTLTVFLAAFPALALETDQFHAASRVLNDSSEALNSYVDDKFNRAIVTANEKNKKVSCPEVADMVMSEIVGKFSISKISQFAKKSPLIERFPDDSLNSWEYIESSIYKDAGFPFFQQFSTGE